MAADYSGIERLLGLPVGSTAGSDEKKIAPVIATAVKDKTTELIKKSTELSKTDELSTAMVLSAGYSIDQIREDKSRLRVEAFEVYTIAKALLNRFTTDLDNMIDPSDKMFIAGGKIIDAVSGSLDKLTNLIMKLEQQLQMQEAMNGTDSADPDAGKPMSPQEWIRLVEEFKNTAGNGPVKDAEIIEKHE